MQEATQDYRPSSCSSMTQVGIFTFTDVQVHSFQRTDTLAITVEENEMSLVVGEIITNIDQIDEGWWQGTSEDGQKSGLFPSNYVELLKSTEAEAEPAPQEAGEASYLEIATALYDYNATEDNELNLTVGDTVYVTEYTSEGWWHGQSQSTGQQGLFPSNYVERQA